MRTKQGLVAGVLLGTGLAFLVGGPVGALLFVLLAASAALVVAVVRGWI